MTLRTLGSAARFYLTRHWQRTVIGPYVVTTTEERKGIYLTTVSWRDCGPEVKTFGSARSFALDRAEEAHEELCQLVERESGRKRLEFDWRPSAA
jgi:hypothetical protein